MKSAVLFTTIILASILISCSPANSSTIGADTRRGPVIEEIWVLEKAYFSNLYKADYVGVLALVHGQFLGWPGNLPQPVDRDESARFMKQLIPKPSSCTLKIEREGIRLMGEVALTQYIIHVKCGDTAGAPKTESTRITHTWVKEGARWKLLGGMSCP